MQVALEFAKLILKLAIIKALAKWMASKIEVGFIWLKGKIVTRQPTMA